jgi:hypothetical protein
MNKLLLTSLSVILFILLLLAGVVYFAFSQSGNSMISTYIQKEAQKAIGLPVEVRKFKLEAGKARLIMRINQRMSVEVVTNYSILGQSFSGIYRLKADNFRYEKMLLRQADMRGQFKGKMEDVMVDGKGTALDAQLAYRLHIVDKKPRNIEAIVKGLSLSELLELSGQAALADGKIDAEIKMPDIGKEFAKGEGHVVLHDGLLNTALVQNIYHVTLPKQSHISANIDTKLHGTKVNVLAEAKSDLFHLKLDKTTVDIKTKNVITHYDMDVKEMGVLTQNALAGPLHIIGDARIKNENIHLTGETASLGGNALFEVDENIAVHVENLLLSKILHLLKQPNYAKGLLNGNIDVDKAFKEGKYELAVTKGSVTSQSIARNFGYQIPSKNSFTLNSKGKIKDNILHANSNLKSSIVDMRLLETRYEIGKQKLQSKYDLFIPNIGLLIPDNKAVKRGYLSLKGDIEFDKYIRIDGIAKGLGDKLDFSYDSKTAKLDAKGLFIEKLLSLAALPRYVKGKLSTDIKISNIKTLDGTFSLVSDALETQPQAMEKLLGKKLKMKVSIKSKGKLENAKAYLDTHIKTSMGTLALNHMVSHTKTGSFKSDYILDIPRLKNLYALTDTKLYGAMLLKGHMVKNTLLSIMGATDSLGGKVHYTLKGDVFTSRMQKVPLENMLVMLGQTKMVQGEARGDIKYNIKTKIGVIDMDINAFKIKANSSTNAVKMFIGKDPSRIIFTSTKLHANLQGDITTYTLMAKGNHAAIEITKGRLDKKANTHRAKFKFVYEKYIVTGTIGGSIDHPSMMVDPSSMMQSKVGKKIQKKLDKALGGEMGKAVGGFLKGLKF